MPGVVAVISNPLLEVDHLAKSMSEGSAIVITRCEEPILRLFDFNEYVITIMAAHREVGDVLKTELLLRYDHRGKWIDQHGWLAKY